MNNISQQQNILISACLLGSPVRYNGTDLFIEHPLLKVWQQQGRLFSLCPEVTGGLAVPRNPAEIVVFEPLKIVDDQNKNVTQSFLLGAQKTVTFAIENSCSVAIMTENSPSCGSNKVYDGSFTGKKIPGMGVTSALLEQNDIRVFNQYQLTELQSFLAKNDPS